ncbi:MAG: molybdenum cofactor guanylyltransferase, partial [Candidatus Brocadiales bacterium]
MTAIILAGGKNVRMGGRNKAFLKIGDKSFIEHQIERLQRVFDEVIISARTPEAYSHLNLPIATDIIPDKGPMGGIYSGLTKAA